MEKNEEYYKKLSKEELKRIIENPKSSEEDIIMASVEFNHREYKEGKFYTIEEIIEYFEEYHTAQLG